MSQYMRLGALFIFLSLFCRGPSALSDVYDGGTYSEDKVNAPVGAMGGRAGSAIPYAVMYADDRDENAVANRAVYVFGDNNVCFKGKFSASGEEKVLVVFSQPTFSADHCIYQKKFNSEISGFSIFAQDGGICMPTYSDASLKEFNENANEKLEVVRHRVSFHYCMDNTISYGDALEKKNPVREYKVVDSPKIPKVTKLIVAAVNSGESGKSGLPDDSKISAETGKVSQPSKSSESASKAPVVAKVPLVAKVKMEEIVKNDLPKKMASHKKHVTASDLVPEYTWVYPQESFGTGAEPINVTVPTPLFIRRLEKKKNQVAKMSAEEKVLPVTVPPSVPALDRKVASVANKVEPEAAVSVGAADISSHKYTIQLASFSTSAEALKNIELYKKKGFPAFELVQKNQGQIRHRVCVGGFDDMPSAQRSLREINEKSIAQGFVQMIHQKDE